MPRPFQARDFVPQAFAEDTDGHRRQRQLSLQHYIIIIFSSDFHLYFAILGTIIRNDAYLWESWTR